MRKFVVRVLLVVLGAAVLAGCAPGRRLLPWLNWYIFSASACQGLPPEERPAIPENNCEGIRPCAAGPMRVMTYNVLCSVCVKPDYDSWGVRTECARE